MRRNNKKKLFSTVQFLFHICVKTRSKSERSDLSAVELARAAIQTTRGYGLLLNDRDHLWVLYTYDFTTQARSCAVSKFPAVP